MRRSGWGLPEKDPPWRAPRWRPTSALWHNLGEAVERAVSRHREHLPAAVAAQAAAAATAPETAAAPAVPRTGRIADRTRSRHADVHRMLAGSSSISEIAAALGLSRNTVRRFVRAASAEELLACDGTGRRPSILDEHMPYLHERWNSGCTNAALLWQEIRARGYQGSCRQVRGYLARFRESTTVPAPAPAPPKARAVTAWIMTRPDRLADADKASLDVILAASPELAAVTASVRDFAVIMNERRGQKLLEPWMTAALAAGEPALRSFVTGLRADQDAVTNGLSLPWSSGAVEGHVNRIILWNLVCQVIGVCPGALSRPAAGSRSPECQSRVAWPRLVSGHRSVAAGGHRGRPVPRRRLLVRHR
jgi:hypothetical protein